MTSEKELRQQILELVKQYHQLKFKAADFVPGETKVNYAGRVFDEKEIQNLVDSSLDFWLTESRYTKEFCQKFQEYTGSKHAILTNSGSSANLLALSALTSDLAGERKLQKGDEVITVAAGFPTTVNPIIQNGLIPVFVDVELPTYNVSVEQIKQAITSKTKAIMIAHTLGNPFDLEGVLQIVKEYDLWLIEDCCDALGSTYNGKMLGNFGHIATYSFYPAHHITIGEGGMVCTNNSKLARAITSLRDWGRDCYCKGGENDTCNRRFQGKHGELPEGYDHKYVYSHVGYNLKVTDMQAAIGVAQMEKLPQFVETRKLNFKLWEQGFKQWENVFILPKACKNSDPSWFAYPVTVRSDANFSRTELTDFLSKKGVETRNLFAGNMIKQPAYLQIEKRVYGSLENTDTVMNSTFFLGTYPGLTSVKIEFALKCIQEFLNTKI